MDVEVTLSFTLSIPLPVLLPITLKGPAMSSTTANSIDVRQIAPRDRHAAIFDRFDALRVGEALELVNDHDPVPLLAQFEERLAGRVEWNTLESGPELWRVRIAKAHAVPVAVVADSCCSGGACCG